MATRGLLRSSLRGVATAFDGVSVEDLDVHHEEPVDDFWVKETRGYDLSRYAEELPLCEDLEPGTVGNGDSCWSTCQGQCPNDVLKPGLAFDFDEIQAACTGDECFQIFTCIGMKDTTAHIMEPLFTLSGIIFFPLGFHAAHHGDDTPMKRFALFLLATTAVRLGVIAFDVAFMHACEMYDTNMMNFVLNSLLPPSPLRVGVQDKLRGLHLFHLELVNGITGNFNILAWYLILSGLWTALFLYATVEAMSLSSLMQNGILGLGVHYGLDQWDEELNRTAIRRKVQSGINSKFMDDAHLPLSQGTHVGRLSNPTYGTQSPPARTYKASQDFSDYSTGFDGVPYELPDEEEDEAEVVRQLAEKLSQEESPEAMLDRAFVA